MDDPNVQLEMEEIVRMQHITYKYHQTSSLLTLTSHTSSYVLLFCCFIKNIIILL